MSVRILVGDCLERLRTLPDASVHCVVTSPPYWGLRDYGVEGAIGLEPTFGEHINTIVTIFREVRRVLRSDGTLWLNYGDRYHNGDSLSGLKPKDLVMMPARVALALQADGWWLRSEIVWHKPNPMPESVRDRPTSAHEKIYLLSKSARYFYDAEAVREEDAGTDHPRNILHRPEPSGGILPPHSGIRTAEGRNGAGRNLRNVWMIATHPFADAHFATFPPKLVEPCIKAGTSEKGCCPECGAPWTRQVEDTEAYQRQKEIQRETEDRTLESQGVARQFSNTPGVVADRITKGWEPSCGCDAGDPIPATVLDPFGGAGTVGLVADRLGRDAILIELNPEYAEMAERRIHADAPLFADAGVSA